MKILLMGKNGQVGWELLNTLAPLGELVSMARQDLDLTNLLQLREAINNVKPDLIVNAAAYTDVDKAEEEEEIAYRVNAEAIEAMVEEAEKMKSAIIHYSTDYIFGGENDKPYVEDDKPNPTNTYGRTKLAGEDILRQSQVPYLIFRTSWAYSNRRDNFLLNTLKLARKFEVLKFVDDQKGSPNWSRFIAKISAKILSRGIFDIKNFISKNRGTYHLSSSGSTTWYGFAKMIIDLDPNSQEHIYRRIIPITSEEYPTSAKRPKFSVLDNKKIEKTFNIKMIRWDRMLQEMMRDINLKI